MYEYTKIKESNKRKISLQFIENAKKNVFTLIQSNCEANERK